MMVGCCGNMFESFFSINNDYIVLCFDFVKFVLVMLSGKVGCFVLIELLILR